MAVLSESVR